MGDEAPFLRVVGPGEGPRPRRPGPAVASILIYALLFGGALWYLRTKSPLFQKPRPGEPRKSAAAGTRSPSRPGRPAAASAGLPSRDALLSGELLPESARPAYFQRLATERCNCGCERTLSDCLAHEQSCSRSPQLAWKLIPDSRWKIQD